MLSIIYGMVQSVSNKMLYELLLCLGGLAHIVASNQEVGGPNPADIGGFEIFLLGNRCMDPTPLIGACHVIKLGPSWGLGSSPHGEDLLFPHK